MFRDSLAVYQTSSVTTAAFGTRGSFVRVTGELDLALAPRLEHAIAGEIRRGHRHLVIDLSGATFLDCASVGTMLRAIAPLRTEPDATVVLAGPKGIVKRLLELLQLDRMFDIVPDSDQAATHSTDADREHLQGWRSPTPQPH
jgi:anti-sigma B factor antagonist